MWTKKNFIVMMICVMVMGLAGCANGKERTADSSIQGEISMEDGVSSESEESIAGPSDEALEEELERYRREREDMIQEVNGLVEGGSPDENQYSFDMSGSFYAEAFDTREITEAYAAARVYVTDELGIKPETKMETYPCIDPRMLAIYDDADKGVADGYENNNIFVCEYSNGEGTWKYLILIRDRKGSAWKVIHNGSSYKE